jgi:hypothetical protein
VSGWSEVFLGIIALATLAMAVVQVGVLVAAGLLARRVNRLVTQVELEIKPIFAHLNVIGRDASRAAALATAQVERVDRIFADVAQRVDQTLNALQATLAVPAGEGRAILSAIRAALQSIREGRGGRGRRSRGEDEDALFI